MPNVHVSCQQAEKSQKAWEVQKNFMNLLMSTWCIAVPAFHLTQ